MAAADAIPFSSVPSTPVPSTEGSAANHSLSAREVDECLERLLGSVENVKSEKKGKIDNLRMNLLGRLNFGSFDGDGFLLTGDAANMVYLMPAAAVNFFPSIATEVQGFLIGLGVFGGCINIVVGICSLVQGARELRKGHKLEAFRLLFDGVLMIAVGVVMIVGPILAKLCPGALITIILNHPAVLAVLFALLALIISIEIFRKLIPIIRGTDPGRQLLQAFQALEKTQNQEQIKPQIEQMLTHFFYKPIKDEETGEEISPPHVVEHLRTLLRKNEVDAAKKLLCQHMDVVEGDIGVRMAIEVFQQALARLQLLIALSTPEGEAIWGKAVEWEKEWEEGDDKAGRDLLVRTKVLRTQCNNNLHTRAWGSGLALSLKDEEWKCHCGGSCNKVADTLAASHNILLVLRNLKSGNERLKKAYWEWKRDLYLRALQQGFDILASFASFCVIGCNVAKMLRPAEILGGIVCVFLWFGNFIPFILDLKMPYSRNVPISVEGVNPQEVTTPPLLQGRGDDEGDVSFLSSTTPLQASVPMVAAV